MHIIKNLELTFEFKFKNSSFHDDTADGLKWCGWFHTYVDDDDINNIGYFLQKHEETEKINMISSFRDGAWFVLNSGIIFSFKLEGNKWLLQAKSEDNAAMYKRNGVIV